MRIGKSSTSSSRPRGSSTIGPTFATLALFCLFIPCTLTSEDARPLCRQTATLSMSTVEIMDNWDTRETKDIFNSADMMGGENYVARVQICPEGLEVDCDLDTVNAGDLFITEYEVNHEGNQNVCIRAWGTKNLMMTNIVHNAGREAFESVFREVSTNDVVVVRFQHASDDTNRKNKVESEVYKNFLSLETMKVRKYTVEFASGKEFFKYSKKEFIGIGVRTWPVIINTILMTAMLIYCLYMNNSNTIVKRFKPFNFYITYWIMFRMIGFVDIVTWVEEQNARSIILSLGLYVIFPIAVGVYCQARDTMFIMNIAVPIFHLLCAIDFFFLSLYIGYISFALDVIIYITLFFYGAKIFKMRDEKEWRVSISISILTLWYHLANILFALSKFGMYNVIVKSLRPLYITGWFQLFYCLTIIAIPGLAAFRYYLSGMLTEKLFKDLDRITYSYKKEEGGSPSGSIIEYRLQ